jgi:hypothetical protein
MFDRCKSYSVPDPATRVIPNCQSRGNIMSVDANIVIDKSGNFLVFHNPAQHPLPPGAGQPITQTKDTSGKVITTSGTVAGVVHNNPG